MQGTFGVSKKARYAAIVAEHNSIGGDAGIVTSIEPDIRNNYVPETQNA